MNQSSLNSIFLIQSSENNSFGTGFIVFQDEKGSYLLTNVHVVEECGEKSLEVDGKKATLLHMGSSSGLDLALLYVEGLNGIALKLSSALAQKGVLFELSGFRQHLHGNHKLEALRGSIKKLSTLYAGSEKIEKYELNIDKEDAIQRGYSGSPVLCPSSGNVIAIITTRYNETHAEAIPMGYLSSLWNDMPQGLLGSEVCDDRVKRALPWMQIGVASGVVATVIAGVALFMPSESGQSLTIGNGNSNVTITQNNGLTAEALERIAKPYEKIIDNLERKLKNSTSEEEKLKLSALLEKANKEKAKKDEEIAKLKELLENSKSQIVKDAKAILEKEGVSKAIEFLQQQEDSEMEQLLQAKMKDKAESYRLEAQLLIVENRYKEAKEAYQKALKYDRNPDTLFDYAYFLQELNYFNEATTTYEQLLVEQRTLAKSNPLLYNSSVAMTLNNLAILYKSKNEMQKAEEMYKEALMLRRDLAKSNPSVYNPYVAMTLNNLANLYIARNEIQKAKEVYQEALIVYRDLAKSNPSVYNPYVATILNNLAILYKSKNEMQKAEEMYKKALMLRRDLAKSNPSVYNPYVAMTLNNLANLYSAKNEIQKAKEAYQEALIVYRDLAKSNPSVYSPYVATILNNLAVVYRDRNEIQKAEEMYKEALMLRRDLAKSNPSVYNPYVAMTLNNLVILYRAKNEMQKAEETYEEALILRTALAKSNPLVYGVDLANSLVMGVYMLHKPMKNLDEAERVLESFKGRGIRKVEWLLEMIEKLRKEKSK